MTLVIRIFGFEILAIGLEKPSPMEFLRNHGFILEQDEEDEEVPFGFAR